ncbi:uncharacterized protein LOC5503483 [Nematostella vectensis]|uniref:uncharacterized protein LOC5503483 n=1 Tax=Nematostella vectensis TaxID=45351 RepID=UPI0013906A1D|nr:uncharacterized protein LOC5503483 [Nematostella vectensis]
MSRRLNTGESDKIWPPYGLVLFISTKEVGVVQSSQAVEEMRVGEYTNVNWSRKTYRTKVLAVADDKLSLMRQEDGYIKLIEDGMLPSPEDLHQIQQVPPTPLTFTPKSGKIDNINNMTLPSESCEEKLLLLSEKVDSCNADISVLLDKINNMETTHHRILDLLSHTYTPTPTPQTI